MALNLPDVVIVNTLNTVLKAIREDYKSNLAVGNAHRSMLYLLFGGVVLGKYDFYENAKVLLITTPESPKHIEAQLSMDHNNAKGAPVIWVTLPSENNKGNSLGIGEGNQDELTFNNFPDQDEYRQQFNYRWATTYQLVIGSENKNESLLLYHLVKSMMIVCINHFDVMGLSNMKLGGSDVKLTTAIPDRFFTKSVTLNFEYESVVPELLVRPIYQKLNLYWKPEGASVAQGPISISTEDEINNSDSDDNAS